MVLGQKLHLICLFCATKLNCVLVSHGFAYPFKDTDTCSVLCRFSLSKFSLVSEVLFNHLIYLLWPRVHRKRSLYLLKVKVRSAYTLPFRDPTRGITLWYYTEFIIVVVVSLLCAIKLVFLRNVIHKLCLEFLSD